MYLTENEVVVYVYQVCPIIHQKLERPKTDISYMANKKPYIQSAMSHERSIKGSTGIYTENPKVFTNVSIKIEKNFLFIFCAFIILNDHKRHIF